MPRLGDIPLLKSRSSQRIANKNNISDNTMSSANNDSTDTLSASGPTMSNATALHADSPPAISTDTTQDTSSNIFANVTIPIPIGTCDSGVVHMQSVQTEIQDVPVTPNASITNLCENSKDQSNDTLPPTTIISDSITIQHIFQGILQLAEDNRKQFQQLVEDNRKRHEKRMALLDSMIKHTRKLNNSLDTTVLANVNSQSAQSATQIDDIRNNRTSLVQSNETVETMSTSVSSGVMLDVQPTSRVQKEQLQSLKPTAETIPDTSQALKLRLQEESVTFTSQLDDFSTNISIIKLREDVHCNVNQQVLLLKEQSLYQTVNTKIDIGILSAAQFQQKRKIASKRPKQHKRKLRGYIPEKVYNKVGSNDFGGKCAKPIQSHAQGRPCMAQKKYYITDNMQGKHCRQIYSPDPGGGKSYLLRV